MVSRELLSSDDAVNTDTGSIKRVEVDWRSTVVAGPTAIRCHCMRKLVDNTAF